MQLMDIGEFAILTICGEHGHQIGVVVENAVETIAPQKRYSGLAQLLTMRRYAPQADGSYRYVETQLRWNQVSMQLRPNYPPTFKAMGMLKRVKGKLPTLKTLTLDDLKTYDVPAYING